MKECPHRTVERKVGGASELAVVFTDEWICANPSCREPFVPLMNEHVLEPVDVTVLDSIAGTFSAILWDYQERMLEKYGLGPVDADGRPSPQDQDPCADGHDRDDNGICRNCNDSPFL